MSHAYVNSLLNFLQILSVFRRMDGRHFIISGNILLNFVIFWQKTKKGKNKFSKNQFFKITPHQRANKVKTDDHSTKKIRSPLDIL